MPGLTLRDGEGRPLPDLSTPKQIAEALQVTPRTVLNWEAEGRIPAAFRSGRVVRFHQASVAEALGIDVG